MNSFREEIEEGEKNWKQMHIEWMTKVTSWQMAWKWLVRTLERLKERRYTPREWKEQIRSIRHFEEQISDLSEEELETLRHVRSVLSRITDADDCYLPDVVVDLSDFPGNRCTFIWSQAIMDTFHRHFRDRTMVAWNLTSDELKDFFEPENIDGVWQYLEPATIVNNEKRLAMLNGARDGYSDKAWFHQSFSGFLMKQSMMMFYHSFPHFYKSLWELYYDQPDILEQVASQCLTIKAFTWPFDRCHPRRFPRGRGALPRSLLAGMAGDFYGEIDGEYPYIPSAGPTRCSLVSRLHVDFRSWFSKDFNLFAGMSMIDPTNMTGFKHRIEPPDNKSTEPLGGLDPENPLSEIKLNLKSEYKQRADRPTISPAVYGFREMIRVHENQYLDRLTREIHSFLRTIASDSGRRIEMDQETSECDHKQLDPDRPTIQVLLGPPGIGKTRKLKSLLTRRWGFYFVAANLNVSANERDSKDLYGAHADGIPSRDLHWLAKMAENYPLMAFGNPLLMNHFQAWTDVLLYTRHRVMAIFRSVAKTYDNRFDHPKYWLEFQNTGDRFSTLFWFLVLRSDRGEGQNFLRNVDFDPVCICLDEAQCDLNSSIIFTDSDQATTSSNFLVIFLAALRISFLKGLLKSIFISGTSLGLTEVKAAVNDVDLSKLISKGDIDNLVAESLKAKNRTSYDTVMQTFTSTVLGRLGISNRNATFDEFANGDVLRQALEKEQSSLDVNDLRFAFQVDCSFPSRNTDKQLALLLKDLKIFYRGFKKHYPALAPDEVRYQKLYQKLCSSVARHGNRLCGRYLWSVLYIEELNGFMERIGRSLMEAREITSEIDMFIEKAADSACQKAKSHLQLRLDKLKSHGRDHLLRRISDVALDAHLFDRQSVFEDDSDMSTIGQAFAHIEETDDGHLKGCFAERLALEAVIEWLLKDQTEIEEKRNQTRRNQEEENPAIQRAHETSERTSLLESLLFQFIWRSSISAASFGIMSEWYLAMQLWASLRKSKEEYSKEIMGAQPFTVRKTTILDRLRNAMRITGNFGLQEYTHKTHLDIPEGAFIPQGQTIAIAHDNKDEISVFDWLTEMNAWINDTNTKSIPRSSFYLPETNAGPDLIFMLASPRAALQGKEKQPKIKKYVCSIQLKTGEVGNGKVLQDAFETTSIYHSYMSPPPKPTAGSTKKPRDWREKRRDRIQALFDSWKGPEDWKDNQDIVFIRILVCSSRTADLPHQEKYKLKVEKRDGPNEHFVFCNAADTTDLFGGLFARMASAMKSSSEHKRPMKRKHDVVDLTAELEASSSAKKSRPEPSNTPERNIPIRETCAGAED